MRRVSCVIPAGEESAARAFSYLGADAAYDGILAIRARREAVDTVAAFSPSTSAPEVVDETAASEPLVEEEGVGVHVALEAVGMELMSAAANPPAPPASGDVAWCAWVDWPYSLDIACYDWETGYTTCTQWEEGEWECDNGCTLNAISILEDETIYDLTYDCGCEEGYVWNEEQSICEPEDPGPGGGGGGPSTFECSGSTVMNGKDSLLKE
jgi:hypothetical protein